MKKDFPYLDVLTGSALFANIARSDAAAMMECLGGSAAHYKSGETILREGEAADRLGLVLTGRAQVTRTDYDGNRSVLTDVGPGEMFAEAFAFADVSRMPVDVTAVEPTDVLLLDAHRITHTCTNACEFHNRLILNLLGVVASKNLAMNRKLVWGEEEGARRDYESATKDKAKASECIACGQCEAACPQQIPVIARLAECAGALEK